MTEKRKRLAWPVLLLAGLALLAGGYLRQEPDVVLMKAITICMECIGIG